MIKTKNMTINLSTYIKQLLVLAAGVLLLSSCNKDVPDPVPVTTPAKSGQTIAQVLNDPSYSILKAAVTKAGLLDELSDTTAVYTVFAPNDAAFALSGISAAVINAMPADQVEAIVRYHIVGGQAVSSSMIPATAPNIQLPTQLVLAPPSPTLPPGLRMPIFPSKKGNAAWVNNIPLTGVDVQASNGIIHTTATIVAPPTAFLWNRISTDPNLTYLKAAILRADEGATPSTSFQAALLNPAASLTVFAPTDAAFKQVLTLQITQALMQLMGLDAATAQAQATVLASTPAVFTNPALATVLTPTTVQGLIAYHVLGFRDFTVNFPTTATLYKTLLNTAIPAHPGVMLQATFGTGGVIAATVKGAVNPTTSNVLINPTPGTGTSDQHYINGVLHEINQVLLPQ